MTTLVELAYHNALAFQELEFGLINADWLMGFWEQLTDYMANHTDPTHLTEYVQRAANQSGGNK